MNKEDIAYIVIAVLVAFPVLAISARIALKPLVDAVLKVYSTSRAESAALDDRRVAQLESEIDVLRTEVHRLREVEEFHRRLEGGPPPGEVKAEPGGTAPE